MHRVNAKPFMGTSGFSFIFFLVVIGAFLSEASEAQPLMDSGGLPFVIAHKGSAPTLERPPVAFEHDRHTKALKQSKLEDCAVCHILNETDKRLINPETRVFKFPRVQFDATDKTGIMYAYHEACIACHKKTAADNKKSGPPAGLCGKCHVKKPEFKKVDFSWNPIFNYARHASHVQAINKFEDISKLGVAEKLEVVGEISASNKTCQLCHHSYDDKRKQLVYKKDAENSCRACHKSQDDKNARSMQKVAHSACIGCHMKLAQKASEVAVEKGNVLKDQDKPRFGPFECKGCHGEHKELTPEEIHRIPRLVRGQKDAMDLTLGAEDITGAAGALQQTAMDRTTLTRMKVVPYNHKAHEPRGQFCNTCHHHSLEKCSNCHTREGDASKGGNITYEGAFHKIASRQSCVGCHSSAKQDEKCAGCHQTVAAEVPKSSCPICHRGAAKGNIIEVPPIPLFWDKEKVPEKLQIKTVEREFKPADMPHLKIVNKLTAISNGSSLARWFHAAKDQALCSGCHHKVDLPSAEKFPTCNSCHGRSHDPKALGKPGIIGAYHRQCVGCHESMKQKPSSLECEKCHQSKEQLQTAGATMPVRETTK
jgi:hypothetical protein